MTTNTRISARIDVQTMRALEYVGVEMYISDCPLCGVIYGLTRSYRDLRYADGKSWRCPNGCSIGYSETEADRQRRQAERLQRDLDGALERLYAEKAQHEATEKERRRILQRARNGVCPHCQRSFVNVARHVETKHPDAGDPTGHGSLAAISYVHKRGRRNDYVKGQALASCSRYVPLVKTAYRWREVDCPQCLAMGGFES